MRPLIILLVLVALLSACAGPQLQMPGASFQSADLERQSQSGVVRDNHEANFRARIYEWQRIFSVYSRLRTAGADLCKSEVKPFWGMWLADQSLFSADDRERAKRLFGIGQELSLLAVSGPATSAGLRAGDIVTKIDGVIFESQAWQGSYLKPAAEVLSKADMHPVEIEISRSGERYSGTLKPEVGCKYLLQIVPSAQSNAIATFDTIVISSGILSVLSGDDELAYVICHELAHNALGHPLRSATNEVVGGTIGFVIDLGLLVIGDTRGKFSEMGAAIGRTAYSQEFDRVADYLSLYFMVKAGFDATKATGVQRKLGTVQADSLYSDYARTHPSGPERTANLEVALQEIANKIVRREPLRPSKLGESQDAPTATVNAADARIIIQQQVKAEPERRTRTATSALKRLTPEKRPEPVRRVVNLIHIKGPIISLPPAVLQLEYYDSGEGRGTSRVIYPESYVLNGEYQTLPWDQPFEDQAKARLVDPDKLVAPANSMLKGFATYSSPDGSIMECAFSVSNSSRIDSGQCFDNKGNVYRISD